MSPRDLNILQDPASSRALKKTSLANIALLFNEDKQDLDLLLPGILRVLQDPVEQIRELAATLILNHCISTHQLGLLVPAVSSRLSHTEIVEEAEEVRLLLVRICCACVEVAKDQASPYCDDLVALLRRTLQDPYPEESCKLVVLLATTCPKTLKYYGGEIATLLKASLHYRHATVRLSGLSALKHAIHVDLTALDESLPHIFTLSRDRSSQVREQVYAVVAWWLINLDDRYTLAHKLLPVLLAALSDDIIQHRNAAAAHFNIIGELYEREWIERCKAQLDFVSVNGQDPSKPRVGSENYLKENAMKIVDTCKIMFTSWNIEEKIQSCRILVALMTFIGDHVTGYTTGILNALVKMVSTDEQELLKPSIGSHVDPSVFLESMLANISSSTQNAATYRTGCLSVLDALIKGSNTIAKLESGQRLFVTQLVNCLFESEVVGNDNIAILRHVSRVFASICAKVVASEGLVGSEGFKLFTCLVLLNRNEQMTGWTDVKHESVASMHLLADRIGTANIYEHYLSEFMLLFNATHLTWTKHSYEPILFEYLVKQCSLTELQLNLHDLLDILRESAGAERDHEIRILAATLLKHIIILKPQFDAETTNRLLGSTLIPLLIWRAGRKAADLRLHALECIRLLIDNPTHLLSVIAGGIQAIVTSVLGNVDDDLVPSRLAALHILLSLLSHHSLINGTQLRLIYPELLTRLNDAQNSLRILTISAIASLFSCISSSKLQDTDLRFDDGILKHIISGLVLHMDDHDTSVQSAVYESMCIVIGTGIGNVVIREVLQEAMVTHRSKEMLLELTNKL